MRLEKWLQCLKDMDRSEYVTLFILGSSMIATILQTYDSKGWKCHSYTNMASSFFLLAWIHQLIDFHSCSSSSSPSSLFTYSFHHRYTSSSSLVLLLIIIAPIDISSPSFALSSTLSSSTSASLHGSIKMPLHQNRC